VKNQNFVVYLLR